ncbi:DNA polymerase III subunit delta' [Opitutales bacterium ASA1]|uniref:DNA polymerase III subunit gamma/tau n=1 Tax=Congregicoccus parvus TaxID=3081749 RepID=UPI002B2CF3AC|nr:DNA polymerase III subunit delta' [Opitutales bacterium ASA1]
MTPPEAVFAESVAGQVISRAIARGRLAHALLLHGPGAETLEAFARQLAARLLALPDAWASSGTSHQDCFTLRPSGKSRQIAVDNTTGKNPTNNMRYFIRQLAQSPMSAPCKVGIVFEADRMNANSANAFLKTLEEPPLDTTILLLTTRPYSLLPTIRSRCLAFRLPDDTNRAEDPAESAWFVDYRAWVRSLGAIASDKAAAARQVMTVEALVARFARWIDGAGSKAISALKESGALETLDDDEVEALKVSTTVGVRQKFFARIETETCALAREIPNSSTALAAATKELERAAGLLRVNLQENTALELFLLASLRAWARRD